MELGLGHLDYMLAYEPLTVEENQALTIALAELKQVYSNVVQAGSATGIALVICWPKQECAGFSQMLRHRTPQALVILAYYCVILDLLDHKWYLKSWGSRVLQDTSDHLDEKWKSWIQWPLRTVLMRHAPPMDLLDDEAKLLF